MGDLQVGLGSRASHNDSLEIQTREWHGTDQAYQTVQTRGSMDDSPVPRSCGVVRVQIIEAMQ
ncbi:MAG: hypothetical protein RL015_46 [Verrucomicrobiota bacterium]|jgi:hypothetical protein